MCDQDGRDKESKGGKKVRAVEKVEASTVQLPTVQGKLWACANQN